MRLALAFTLGVITATPIAGAVGFAARSEATREVAERAYAENVECAETRVAAALVFLRLERAAARQDTLEQVAGYYSSRPGMAVTLTSLDEEG